MQPEPPPGANAVEVNAWWNALTEDQRNQLIAEHPPELGNLNGIPASVRDQINRAVLNDDLAKPRTRAPDRNAVQVKQGLDHDKGADPANPRPGDAVGVRPLWHSAETAAPRSRSATRIVQTTSR